MNKGVGKHEWQEVEEKMSSSFRFLKMMLSPVNSDFMFDLEDSLIAIIKSESAVNSSFLCILYVKLCNCFHLGLQVNVAFVPR